MSTGLETFGDEALTQESSTLAFTPDELDKLLGPQPVWIGSPFVPPTSGLDVTPGHFTSASDLPSSQLALTLDNLLSLPFKGSPAPTVQSQSSLETLSDAGTPLTPLTEPLGLPPAFDIEQFLATPALDNDTASLLTIPDFFEFPTTDLPANLPSLDHINFLAGPPVPWIS